MPKIGIRFFGNMFWQDRMFSARRNVFGKTERFRQDRMFFGKTECFLQGGMFSVRQNVFNKAIAHNRGRLSDYQKEGLYYEKV